MQTVHFNESKRLFELQHMDVWCFYLLHSNSDRGWIRTSVHYGKLYTKVKLSPISSYCRNKTHLIDTPARIESFDAVLRMSQF